MNKYVTNLTLPNGTNVLIKDSECRTNLSNEINRATKKETWLQNNIDTVELAREDGDHTLHQLIINESNRATKKEESLQNLIESINNAQHPIGSIYMSISSTSPASLFGGTWEQINDKFLLSAGSTYRAGSTGGEATHKLTISEMPSHNHNFSGSGTTGANNRGHTHIYTKATGVQGHTLTINEIPNHSHITNPLGYAQHFSIGDGYTTAVTDGYGNRNEVSTTATGGGASHSHGLSTSSTDSGAESQNHTHSFSYSGTTGNIGSSNDHNNMPPYLTVYMWKRIS